MMRVYGPDNVEELVELLVAAHKVPAVQLAWGDLIRAVEGVCKHARRDAQQHVLEDVAALQVRVLLYAQAVNDYARRER